MRTLAALSLAVGIGLAAALASIVDAILLRPLPVDRPAEVFRVFTASEGQPFGFVSYPDFEEFQGAIAECLIPVAVGEPARMKMALAVTPNYFQVLGVGARFGRTFASDDRMVAVLAHGGAGDIGKSLRVGGKLYTVIGVAPENFGLDRFLHEDLYIPIRSYGDGKILKDRSRRFLTVHVRGKKAAAEIPVVAARLEREYPATNRGRRAVVLDELTARLRTDKMMTPLAGLLGALGALILAAGCANACGALSMRAEARAKITSIKIALGASPLRLLGESLRESGCVAGTGCALALPLAWAVTEALRRSIVLPTDFSISISTQVNGRVIALAFGSAVLAAMVCLLRLRNALATVEIALATALVATGGSLWMGLNAAKSTDLGYRTGHVSVITFDPGQSGYDEAHTRAFYRSLMERVRALPGVKGVALAQCVPLGMIGSQRQLRIRDEDEVTVWMNIVSPEYFAQMRIGLVAGRLFEERDGAAAIVNEELAKRIGFGQQMRVAGRTVEVVGVVKTAKYMRWDEAPRPFFYLPYGSNYASRMTLHVDAAGDVIGAVRKMAPEFPMSDARPLREYFDNGAMFGVKIALRVAGVVGVGGVLLAMAGLYGIVSSLVVRRRREIGIRMALGAPRAAVFAMILRQGMTMAVAGTMTGLVAAELGSRLLRGLVPGSGASIWADVGAAALMMAVSLAACAVPAVRALRVDPAVVLRKD